MCLIKGFESWGGWFWQVWSTPTNSSQSDNLQEPLYFLGDCIDERKELYFQCETEEGADELKKADLDSCVSDQ